MPCLADVDPRNHLPDELQIHLRHDDPGLEAAARDGDPHVGLRPVPEVDRAELRGAELRGEEPALAGVVAAPIPDGEAEPAPAQWLRPGSLEGTPDRHPGPPPPSP